MESLSSFEALSRQYLLGALTETELATMQETIFTDPEKFYQVCESEDLLIEDYLRDALPTEQRRRFEQHYLANPARKQRVEFARVMAQQLRQPETRAAEDKKQTTAQTMPGGWPSLHAFWRAPRFAAGLSLASLLLLALGIGWWWQDRNRLREEIAQLRAALSPTSSPTAVASVSPSPIRQLSPSPTSSKPALTPAPANEARVVTLTLIALSLRSETASARNELRLTSDTEQVQFLIRLPMQNFSRYSLHLQDAREQTVLQQEQLKPIRRNGTASLRLLMPAQRLSTGTYLLTVAGQAEKGDVTPVSKLELTVTRK